MGFSMILADNNNSDSNNQPNIISAGNNNGEEVCCHIFGFGVNMKKVNSQYELMEEDNCTVPEDFVGGGREVVSEKRFNQEID